MSTKLFVGNLSFDVTENDLQDAFAAHGSVTEVNLIMDKMSGRSRGFAFVTMAEPQAAQNAVKALNGANLNGRPLTVNEARPREERSGGGGGGGFRGRSQDRSSGGGGGGGGGRRW
jgi:cold-inducible RNA-binding protein